MYTCICVKGRSKDIHLYRDPTRYFGISELFTVYVYRLIKNKKKHYENRMLTFFNVVDCHAIVESIERFYSCLCVIVVLHVHMYNN